MEGKSEKSEDLRHKAEDRLSQGTGLAEQALSDADVRALLHELQVHQIELEIQNDELLLAKAETEDAMRKYSNLYNFAPVGYLTIDDKSLIIEANLAAGDLLGFERSALISIPFWLFVSPQDNLAFDTCCKTVTQTNTRQSCEIILIRNRKEPLNALIDIDATKEGDDDVQHYRITITDISKLKQAEEALRRTHDELEDIVEKRTQELNEANQTLQNEITERRRAEVAQQESLEKYRALFNSIDEAFCIIEMIFDADGNPVDFYYLEVNPVFEKQTGLREAQGKSIRELVPDIEAYWFEIYGEIALTGEPMRFVREAKALDRWFDVYAFRLGERESKRVAAVFNDVTSRKQMDLVKDELLDREHRIADVLQKALIPTTEYDIPGCEIAVRYEPASKEAEVGGDFYDVFVIGDGKIGIVIGDVTGKGLPAAISVAAARHSIRSYAYIDPRPGRVMTLANEALCRNQPGEAEGGMLTAFFAIIDTRFGGIAYSSGGHEPPLVRRADGSVEKLVVKGRLMGVVGGFEYPEDSRKLQPGDVVVMVTDGITEARRDSRGLFGIEGVERYLSDQRNASPDEIADGLLQAAKAHAGGELGDDVAVVVVSLKNGK